MSAGLLIGVLSLAALGAVGETPEELVDTRYGAVAPDGKVVFGSALVGPCRPYGAIAPGPDTLFPDASGLGYPAPSGFRPGQQVTGFSQLHAHGTGGHPTYGLFLVSATTSAVLEEVDLASPMELLVTRPSHFACELTRWSTHVEIMAGRQAALYRFRFPKDGRHRIVLNARRKLGNPKGLLEGGLTIDGRTVRGGGRYHDNWNPAEYDCFVAAEFAAMPMASGLTDDKTVAWLEFDEAEVTMKIALSFTSAERAASCLTADLPGWDFEACCAEARASWNRELGKIRADGFADPQAKRIFYSNLYHTMIQPRDRTGDVPGWREDEPVWDDQYTVWDTWKTLLPLMSIVSPERYAAIVNSFGARLRHNGDCAASYIQTKEYRTGQAGDDVDNVIADAFAKKIPGIDWSAAAEVLKFHATERTPDYRQRGYVCSDLEHPAYCYRMASGSSTLGFAYNDWCAAQVLRGLGEKNLADELQARSGNWTNVWDDALVDGPSGYRGFVRGKASDGRWIAPDRMNEWKVGAFSARQGYNSYFYEGTCWDYSFTVFNDIPGMIGKMGGAGKFAERLEYALAQNLIDFGNEPSFMTIWMFDFVGRPDRCSFWANRLRERFCRHDGWGLPGDDDSGAMGSLYVFLTAGFFPIAGTDLYMLHGPSVEELVFDVGEGKTFTIRAPGASKGRYAFDEVRLNGRKLPETMIRHADIAHGGVLEFMMAKNPAERHAAARRSFAEAASGGVSRRLPAGVLPENAFLWFETGDFEPENDALMRERLDILFGKGTFNLLTLSLRCPPDLSDPVTVARVREVAEYVQAKGAETVMDVDPRIARREFLTRWPEETQRFVQYAVVTSRAGRADFLLEADRMSDHMSGGTRDYTGWKEPKLFSAAAFRLDADGKADPYSRRDVRHDVKITLCGTDLIAGSVSGLADGEVLVVSAEFELFEADVCSPHLLPFTRELVARYARLPIQSVMRDEWGFAAPRKAMREHRAFWHSRHFAEAYARHSGGRDYASDLELLALPIRGREGERYAAIDAYMRTIFRSCAETECDFYAVAKRTFGPDAHAAKHPTWWTGFNVTESLHNGIDWWAAKRDWGQTDESVPLPVANALAKKFGGPCWLNECYASDPAIYNEAIWRYAVGGGRVVYHPLTGLAAKLPTASYADRVRLSCDGLVKPATVCAQSRVRLVNLITDGQADSPVAVFFGHSRLVNWEDPAYLDWGEEFMGGLMRKGYFVDLYPADEFGQTALLVDGDGYVRMGCQRYEVCCLRRLSATDAEAFERWRKGRELKTVFVSWDSPALHGVTPLSTDDSTSVAARLAKLGAASQTPPDERPFGPEDRWQGVMTPPDGTLRLTDGTVVRYKGCCPDPAGDLIEGVLVTSRGEASYKARGVFAARFDEQGRLEALAAGGLERVSAGGFTLNPLKPLDLALVRENGQWRGVIQSDELKVVPDELKSVAADWSILRVSGGHPEIKGLLGQAHRVVFVGDSITEGGQCVVGGYYHEVTNALRTVYGDKAPEIYPAGIAGSEVNSWLTFEERSRTKSVISGGKDMYGRRRDVREALGSPADIVMVFLGMNDLLRPTVRDTPESWYEWKEKMRDLGRRLVARTGAKTLAYATITPLTNDFSGPKNAVRKELNARLRELAVEENALVLPLGEAIEDLVRREQAMRPDARAVRDFIHPNVSEGHLALATALLKAFGEPEAAKVPEAKLERRLGESRGMGPGISWRLDASRASQIRDGALSYDLHWTLDQKIVAGAGTEDVEVSVRVPKKWEGLCLSPQRGATTGNFCLRIMPDRLRDMITLEAKNLKTGRMFVSEVPVAMPWLVSSVQETADQWRKNASTSAIEWVGSNAVFVSEAELARGVGFGRPITERGGNSPWRIVTPTLDYAGLDDPDSVDTYAHSFGTDSDTWYAARWFVSPVSRTVRLQVSHATSSATLGLRVWLNGKPVLVDALDRRNRKRSQEVPVELKSGTNLLFVRCDHHVCQRQFAVSLKPTKGDDLGDLAYSIGPAKATDSNQKH